MNTPLPPQGPYGPDDELPDEAGLAALYRLLPQSEPSPALDAAILHAAAQAIAPSDTTQLPHGERRNSSRDSGDRVHAKTVTDIASVRPAKPSFATRAPRHRTLVALASAASLVLVAGLAWHMRGMNAQDTAPMSSRATPESAAVANAPAAAAVVPPSVSTAKIAVHAEITQDRAAVGSVTEDIAANAAPTVAPAQVAQPRMAVRIEKAAAAPPAMPEAEPVTTPITSKPQADKSMDDRSAMATEHAQAREQALSASAQPAPPPAVEEMASAPVIPAPPPAPAAPPSMAEPSAPVAMVNGLPDELQAPDASPTQVRELEAIIKLFADHHDREAQQRLEAFHQRHPQWQLQPELQARLRKP